MSELTTTLRRIAMYLTQNLYDIKGNVIEFVLCGCMAAATKDHFYIIRY